MKYFTYLASNTVPNNALQRQALAVLEAESNLLINDKHAFIGSLRDQINKLNFENPRCKPLSLSTYGTTKTNIGIFLGGHYTVGFYLYAVKNGGDNPNAK